MGDEEKVEEKAKVTCKDIFEAMPARFLPENAVGWNAVVQFNVEGEGGGTWTLTVKDGACSIAEGAGENPTATLNTDAETWVGMAVGTVNAQTAFFTGKVKIQGNMNDIMKINGPAFKKEVPSGVA